MTQIRWTTRAADDFARIVERIRDNNPTAAQRVARTIYEGVFLLRTMPSRGRPGRVANTRELIFLPWPYIVVYELAGEQAHILRIRHAAKNWP